MVKVDRACEYDRSVAIVSLSPEFVRQVGRSRPLNIGKVIRLWAMMSHLTLSSLQRFRRRLEMEITDSWFLG
jgi:hypothetical protein